MSTHLLRAETDKWFSAGNCLRNLATEIASLDWAEASNNGLLSASPAPFNLLSNGETGSTWSSPDQVMPTDLVAWKKGANGFGGSTARGVSLIFDPFVDACLLMNIRTNRTLPQKPSVLVLTDYYPLKHLIGEMALLLNQDWGAIVTDKFLSAKELGLTERNLFKTVLNRTSIRDVRELDEQKIAAEFANYRLLVWNYFPFLRGGFECEGMSGLPQNNCDWILYCDERLADFLKCVDAYRIILAMNGEVKAARVLCLKKSKSTLQQSIDSGKYVCRDFSHPRSWTSAFEKKSAEFRDILKG